MANPIFLRLTKLIHPDSADCVIDRKDADAQGTWMARLVNARKVNNTREMEQMEKELEALAASRMRESSGKTHQSKTSTPDSDIPEPDWNHPGWEEEGFTQEKFYDFYSDFFKNKKIYENNLTLQNGTQYLDTLILKNTHEKEILNKFKNPLNEKNMKTQREDR